MHGLREAANKGVRRVKGIRAENIFTVPHVHRLGMLSSLVSNLGTHYIRDLDVKDKIGKGLT